MHRRPRRCEGIWPDNRLQCPSAGIDVAAIGALVAAENGEVLAIPVIAVPVVVIGIVIPQGVSREGTLGRGETPVHGHDLSGEVSGAGGLSPMQVKTNAYLADDH